jgi:hypothetical protein
MDEIVNEIRIMKEEIVDLKYAILNVSEALKEISSEIFKYRMTEIERNKG